MPKNTPPENNQKGLISPDRASLDRNPQLRKHWLTRIFARGIIAGAAMDESGWKMTTRYFLYVPIVCVVLISTLFDESTTSSDIVGTLLFVFCLGVVGPVLMLMLRYGYKNRKNIDSSGVLPLRANLTWRYAALGAGIAAVIRYYSPQDWW